MKKKVIIIISLIAVFALGGSIALAATADGQWVNPFSRLLEEKVEDGTITADEAGIFSKVWDAIKADRDEDGFCGPGRMGGIPRVSRPEFDEEALAQARAVAEELHEAMEAKVDEVVAGLVSEGYITQEEVEALDDRPMGFWLLVRDADEETRAALEAAMVEIRDFHEALVQEKIDNGELPEGTAGFMMGGRVPFAGCDMDSFGGPRGRFPGFDRETDGN